MVAIKKMIPKLVQGHNKFIKEAEIGRRYYDNDNDIKKKGVRDVYKTKETEVLNPLSLADNRISHNWHELLVNQKVGYSLTYAPIIDLDNDELNKQLKAVLSDDFAIEMKDLAIDASNCGVAWLHLWEDDNSNIQYANVDPVQVIPILSNTLKQNIIGVIRYYSLMDEKGDTYNRYEYWDDQKVQFYQGKGDEKELHPESIPNLGEETKHHFGMVPFIPFYNNNKHTSDLRMYKDLLDAYDKVVSGFTNDLDDVQEVIFVLENYGGTNKEEFIRDLKESKVIKVDTDGGASIIRAEIPHEARNIFLERTERQIFISGMGVNPDPERFGTASGVALKFLYSLLELKTGLMETQFRSGLNQFIRALANFYGWKIETIEQTWTRNMIVNDLETAQIAKDSLGIISQETIVKNHPWVDEPKGEMEKLKQEQNSGKEDEYGKQVTADEQ